MKITVNAQRSKCKVRHLKSCIHWIEKGKGHFRFLVSIKRAQNLTLPFCCQIDRLFPSQIGRELPFTPNKKQCPSEKRPEQHKNQTTKELKNKQDFCLSHFPFTNGEPSFRESKTPMPRPPVTKGQASTKTNIHKTHPNSRENSIPGRCQWKTLGRDQYCISDARCVRLAPGNTSCSNGLLFAQSGLIIPHSNVAFGQVPEMFLTECTTLEVRVVIIVDIDS